jgi:hypothetical protein
MMTLFAAAALAAQPVTPAPASPQMQHDMHMHMGMDQSAEHKGMDCCKDCCKDMAAKHEGQDSEHSEHSSH